ncbi:MAG: TIGR02594 family protein [Desulfobulbaceae bacterium]|nr:TIGR02594 family protein [Desulfobulbaceae bacterium]
MSDLLKIALSQYGQEERPGDKNNPTIVNYSKELGKGFERVNDDETPWCSIFINWVCLKAGVERSKSASARSWLKVGEKVEHPEPGDIVVFIRGNNPAQGHVGIFICKNNRHVTVLGGNQNNRVQISENYLLSSVLEYRRLKKLIT